MAVENAVERVSRIFSRRPPRPPANAIIVACERIRHYRLLAPYLEQAGFQVAVVASDSWAARMTTVRLSALKRLARDPDYANVPVVVADDGTSAPFRSLAPRVAPMLGKGQRLLHPSFLADFVDHDVSPSVVTYGFPGSGNVIVQTIMHRLLAPKRRGRPDLLEAMCIAGHIVLHDVLRQALTDLGGIDVNIGYAQPGSLVAYALFGPRQEGLILPSVPSKMFMGESVYGTHSAPRPDIVARVKKSGARVAVVLRHPLDVIVSVSAKNTAGVAPEERLAAIHEIINNDDVYYSSVYNQVAFLSSVAELAD